MLFIFRRKIEEERRNPFTGPFPADAEKLKE